MPMLKQFPRYLSVEVLRKAGACDNQVDHFQIVFGDKPVKVTLSYLKRAHDEGFPCYWRFEHSGWFTWEERAEFWAEIHRVPDSKRNSGKYWREPIIWKHIKLSWAKADKAAVKKQAKKGRK